jgi:hypothetical protein
MPWFGIGAWSAKGVFVVAVSSCLKCLQDDNIELDLEALKLDQVHYTRSKK